MEGGTSKLFDVDQGSLNATSFSINDDDLVLNADKYTLLFTQHLVEENNLECRSKVDRYFLDKCEASTPKFDILAWWKMNSVKYPILTEITSDALVILIFTIAFESTFSIKRCI